jgi:DeoR/GlpR family transcriptional regulator of sugar metabolism
MVAIVRPSSQAGKTQVRQAIIADRVMAEGSCTAQDLADDLGVSIMTIHRDLVQLERRGLVRKFRGGVRARPPGAFESQVAFRMAYRWSEKDSIAQAALKYVQPGMSLLLDDSTTALPMIRGLGERAPLHVATSFLTAIRQLSDVAAETDLTLLALGGVYDVSHDSFSGLQTIEQLGGLLVDALFMSVSAVSTTHALDHEERKVALKRAMMRSAAKTYLLVDHTKLGRTALHRLVPLTEVDLVITDAEVDPAVLQAWDAADVRYEIAPRQMNTDEVRDVREEGVP